MWLIRIVILWIGHAVKIKFRSGRKALWVAIRWDSEIGRASAEESLTEIKEVVGQTDTVFITAGMGGGTGTGASLVVARESRKAGAFTVALVTKPFNFEGEGPDETGAGGY